MKQLFLFVLIIIEIGVAEIVPDDVFKVINLSHPGLEIVKENFENKNYKAAHKELLTYFQNRDNRNFDFSNFSYDLSVVKQNMQNVFTIKNETVNFGDDIDWKRIHKDKEWQFSLGRMNWFQDYIGAYISTKDESIIEAWMQQTCSWIALGDPGFPRTIDTGRRMENLCRTYWIFVNKLKSPTITPEFHSLLLASIAQQSDFLYQPENWRKYSNWGTFENSGFAISVIMFPEFLNNEKWLKEIFFRMRFQLSNSFHKDGMHIEVTPSYLSHEVEVWFDFLKNCEKNGITPKVQSQIPLPPIKDLILKPVYALSWFYKPDGIMSQISDTDADDERKFIKKVAEYWNLSDLLWIATQGKEGTPSDDCNRVLQDGGYAFIRSGWGDKDLSYEDEFYLLFDTGTNQPWHAHYDILNVVVSAYGHSLLKDPGRYTYNDGPEREAFKSTAYHNTVSVDKSNQERYYTPPPCVFQFLGDMQYLSGSHNAYEGVTHKRTIISVPKKYWIITDFMESENLHDYDQNWHLSDEALGKVKYDKNSQKVSAPHFEMFLLNNGVINIDNSWLSPKYRQKIEAPIVTHSMNQKQSVIIPAVLVPFDEQPENYQCKMLSSSHEFVDIEINHNDLTDYYHEKNTTNSLASEIFLTDASVVWISMDKTNKIHSFYMKDGTYLKIGNKKLISDHQLPFSVSFDKGTMHIEEQCPQNYKFDKSIDINNLYVNKTIVQYKRKGKTIYVQRSK